MPAGMAGVFDEVRQHDFLVSCDAAGDLHEVFNYAADIGRTPSLQNFELMCIWANLGDIDAQVWMAKILAPEIYPEWKDGHFVIADPIAAM